jgi:hypothetical protein
MDGAANRTISLPVSIRISPDYQIAQLPQFDVSL